MSDAEKFESQGRAHAALKQAKSNAATIKAKLLQYEKSLIETAEILRRFLADPTYANPVAPGLTMASTLTGRIQSIGSDEMIRLVEELVAETASADNLEEQIKQF